MTPDEYADVLFSRHMLSDEFSTALGSEWLAEADIKQIFVEEMRRLFSSYGYDIGDSFNEIAIGAMSWLTTQGGLRKTGDKYAGFYFRLEINSKNRVLEEFLKKNPLNQMLINIGESAVKRALRAIADEQSWGLSNNDMPLPPELNSDIDETVDSSTWTGLPRGFVLTEEKRTALVNALEIADDSLRFSEANQHDRAQAHAYIVAAKSLLEAPDAQPELAWEIIERANNLAGIASLFISIIGLFTS